MTIGRKTRRGLLALKMLHRDSVEILNCERSQGENLGTFSYFGFGIYLMWLLRLVNNINFVPLSQNIANNGFN